MLIFLLRFISEAIIIVIVSLHFYLCTLSHGTNGKTEGVHKANGTNGNETTGCILYQTCVLLHIRTVILIQCVSGLPSLFCTPQPSKDLGSKAFLRYSNFLPFAEYN